MFVTFSITVMCENRFSIQRPFSVLINKTFVNNPTLLSVILNVKLYPDFCSSSCGSFYFIASFLPGQNFSFRSASRILGPRESKLISMPERAINILTLFSAKMSPHVPNVWGKQGTLFPLCSEGWLSESWVLQATFRPVITTEFRPLVNSLKERTQGLLHYIPLRLHGYSTASFFETAGGDDTLDGSELKLLKLGAFTVFIKVRTLS